MSVRNSHVLTKGVSGQGAIVGSRRGRSLREFAISSDVRWAATANFTPDARGRLWDLHTDAEPKLGAEMPFGATAMESSLSRGPPLGGVRRLGCFGEGPRSPRRRLVQARAVFRGYSRVLSVAFSPDSRLLVTRSADETIMLWHVGLSDLVAIACRTAGPKLTAKDVADLIGDEQARRPCVDQP